ncbi:MAG: GDSL-type esterase/lipase family protein [Candidatus Methylacidiphilales bacterium]|nr:GDSL-type esterase/lipase family protein [Candidatus Methylacidiphilales bacterium]
MTCRSFSILAAFRAMRFPSPLRLAVALSVLAGAFLGFVSVVLALDPPAPMSDESIQGMILPFPAKTLLHRQDRIVFIGDSITGQGANVQDGWRHLIQKGLTLVSMENQQKLISLGGSGQTVGSWVNVEMRSRDTQQFLDVKDVDVKAELDQPADVVVFMLGMNDALLPSMADTDEAADKWIETYSELIRSVRSRCNPRVVAIATPTLCTEDTDTPKNLFLNRLSDKIEELAKKEGYYALQTRLFMEDVLNTGRTYRPDFHVTTDYVHPNFAGHYAIAAGILRSLGEKSAQKALLKEYEAQIYGKEKPPLSYTAARWPNTPAPEAEPTNVPVYNMKQVYFVKLWTPGSNANANKQLTMEGPSGWQVQRQGTPGTRTDIRDSANYNLIGIPDRLVTEFPVKLPPYETKIRIQAPWLIGVAQNPGPHWVEGKLDPAKAAAQPSDTEFSDGKGFGTKPAMNGRPVKWFSYIASSYWDGNNSPGSIDMAAVTFYQTFYTAYGVRWLYSDVDRPVEVLTSPLGFVNNNYLTLWVNGEKLCAGVQLKKGDKVTTTLKKGWNSMVFRSDHSTWQWAFALDIRGLNGDELKDVRVSLKEPDAPPASPTAPSVASGDSTGAGSAK